MVNEITDRLFQKYEESLLAIGVYGSIANDIDGPFSDIEMHVVSKDGHPIQGHEFVYDRFKIEISTIEKSDIIRKAEVVDDSWAITAGVFIHVLPLYDPEFLFEELKELPYQLTDKKVKEVMREFFIWEPYETVGKLRNNYRSNNLSYIPLGAKDLSFQTAKLIGLANKKHYSTRAKTWKESLGFNSKPTGYVELTTLVMSGDLHDTERIYMLCEKLWIGLNEWFEDMNIDYRRKELPF